MHPRKLILSNFQSPGDIVMLTAAVRDLHLSHPGEFITDVRTSCPDLWLQNPWLTPLDGNDPEVETLPCHYPLIHQSNQLPYHFIHGFMEYLGERLGVRIPPHHFKGDIHLTDEEKSGPFPGSEEIAGRPFWIIAAGGKFDFTIKWWESSRYQEVVDHFGDRILFVQVGEDGHHHPPLSGVLDLRGRTSLRELILLMYHAQGVLCPVTLLMHLAAAVETPPGRPQLRPCVVVAGGREPPHWEAYPAHRFLHTVGMLDCCATGGCWRSRTLPLGDDSSKDHPYSLCSRVVGNLPRCMDMITVEKVIDAIEGYLSGGMADEVSPPLPQSPEFPAEPDSGNFASADQEGMEQKVSGIKSPCIVIGTDETRLPLDLRQVLGAPPPAMLFPEVPSPGLVVGTYGSLAYVHLHLEARRRFYPQVPLLVHDDASDKTGKLAGLCQDYGALFETNSSRAGHQHGDLSVLIGGLLWARREGIPLLAKMSRRFIPRRDWSAGLSALAMESQYATYSSWTRAWNFGFRTECFAVAVRAWNEEGLVRQLAAKFLSSSGLLVEAFVHDLARQAAFRNGAAARAYDVRIGERPSDRTGYAVWDFAGFDRVVPSPDYLWHNSTDPTGYFALAQEWGLPWKEEDFHAAF